MNFADRLNILFKTRNKSLRNVADDIEITPSTLSRYLSGKHEPDYGSLVKLCKYFGVSMDWLGGLSDDPTNRNRNEISFLYEAASAEDKKIVDLVLDKYKT